MKKLVITMLAMTLIGSSFAGDRDSDLSLSDFDNGFTQGAVIIVEGMVLKKAVKSILFDEAPKKVKPKTAILQGVATMALAIDFSSRVQDLLYLENPSVVSPFMEMMAEGGDAVYDSLARDYKELETKINGSNNKYTSRSEQVVTE